MRMPSRLAESAVDTRGKLRKFAIIGAPAAKLAGSTLPTGQILPLKSQR
jgi:hypothetical protein